MNKKIILLSTLLLVASAAFLYADKPDGYLWDKLTEAGKAVFIVGMLQGESNILNLLAVGGEDLLSKALFEEIKDTRTIEEVAKDIDYFYETNKDRKNLPIGYVYLITLHIRKK